jgi:hypothetical protein
VDALRAPAATAVALRLRGLVGGRGDCRPAARALEPDLGVRGEGNNEKIVFF